MAWHSSPRVAARLSRPSAAPGGAPPGFDEDTTQPTGLAAFHEAASAALVTLAAAVAAGLGEQTAPGAAGDANAAAATAPALDTPDLRVPLLQSVGAAGQQAGATLVVALPEGAAPDSQAAAHAAEQAARAAGVVPGQQPAPAIAFVPASCLALASWREAAGTGAFVAPSSTAGERGARREAAAGEAAAAAAGDEDALAPGSDLLITIAVFEATAQHKRVLMQELQVLGSNSLAELRDAVSCPTDKLAAGLGQPNPAAYLYLEGAFFNDTRQASAAECSALLQQWAAKVGMPGPRHLNLHASSPLQQPAESAVAALGAVGEPQPLLSGDTVQQQPAGSPQQQVHSAAQQEQRGRLLQPLPPLLQQQSGEQAAAAGGDMQGTLLSDLTLRASNQPTGLYCHQGVCEHALMVSDVRLLHADDKLSRAAYPRTLYRAGLGKRFSCSLCKRPPALTLLLHHPHAPEDVSMLCPHCATLFPDAGSHPGAKLIPLDVR